MRVSSHWGGPVQSFTACRSVGLSWAPGVRRLGQVSGSGSVDVPGCVSGPGGRGRVPRFWGRGWGTGSGWPFGSSALFVKVGQAASGPREVRGPGQASVPPSQAGSSGDVSSLSAASAQHGGRRGSSFSGSVGGHSAPLQINQKTLGVPHKKNGRDHLCLPTRDPSAL